MQKIQLWFLYCAFLISALFAIAVDGEYPFLARDTDGYNVLDLSTIKADSVGKINAGDVKIDTLEVTTSVSLPAVGSVPVHTIAHNHDTIATGAQLDNLVSGNPADGLHYHTLVSTHTIAGTHDTVATGAQLDTLVGGASSDAATLHTHTDFPETTTFDKAVTISGRTLIYGKTSRFMPGSYLGFEGVTSATEYATLRGRLGEHGSAPYGEALYWSCDDNAASPLVTDLTGHWTGFAYVSGTGARTNTSNITTTTAISGGRAFWLTGAAGNKSVVSLPTGMGVSPAWQIWGLANQDFTVSLWHKPAKISLGSTEYPLYGGSTAYLALTGTGYYRLSLYPTGGSAVQITTPTGGYYGTGFHHFLFVRRGTTISFYMDGVLVGSNTNSTNANQITGSFRLGALGNARGVFDEVRVFRHAVSPGQIAALYNAGSGTTTPLLPVTSMDGALNLPSRNGYVAELWNTGGTAESMGLRICAGKERDFYDLDETELLTYNDGLGQYLGGVVSKQGGIYTYTSSDARMKSDITLAPVTNAVKNIPVKSFRFLGGKNKRIGFVAQDVQKYIPDAVIERMDDRVCVTSSTLGSVSADNGTTLTLSNGMKIRKDDPKIKLHGDTAVRYSTSRVKEKRLAISQDAMFPALWQTVQDQERRISDLEKRLSKLEKQIGRSN